jgi:hypothetical protein
VTVRIRTDADVRVTISREDGTGAQTFVGPRELQLAPGNYRVQAIGRDKLEMAAPAVLRVDPGPARDYTVPYVRGIYALQSTSWATDGGEWIKLTRTQAMLDASPLVGRVSFTVKIKDTYYSSGPFQSGGPLMWVYGYEDDQNYYSVSLTSTDVQIARKANGVVTILQKIPHQFVQRVNVEYANYDGVEFAIDFGGGAPVHRYRLLPKYARPGDKLPEWKILPGDFPRAPGGRFGFIASKPNALVIKTNFRFTPPIK